MPTVQDILAGKGSRIFTINSSATVLEATHVMNDQSIGALVVMEANKIAGIFTERDVLRRVIAQEKNPATMPVHDAMTREIVCCGPDEDLDDVSRAMADRRIRHMPVCTEEGGLVGMISIGDVNAMHASRQEAHISFLNEYVYGRA